MIRSLLLLAALTGGTTALADIPPANSRQCQGAATGSACTTDDGRPGTCVATMVSRPDYSAGFPPKTKQVEMVLCVASASAKQVSALPFALGAALMVLVLGGLVASRLAARGRREAATAR